MCMCTVCAAGEEHAGLQLLKTAQRRFPRDGELHQKIQQLEQKIKRQGKVNYYKVRRRRPPAPSLSSHLSGVAGGPLGISSHPIPSPLIRSRLLSVSRSASHLAA
jgi:hypothetical protein